MLHSLPVPCMKTHLNEIISLLQLFCLRDANAEVLVMYTNGWFHFSIRVFFLSFLNLLQLRNTLSCACAQMHFILTNYSVNVQHDQMVCFLRVLLSLQNKRTGNSQMRSRRFVRTQQHFHFSFSCSCFIVYTI